MVAMNPYNFVRLGPMDEGARQKPLGHKALVNEYHGERVHNGRLQVRLTAFGPLMVLSHHSDDVTETEGHKHFQRFFHYSNDFRPIIPGSSLKGMVRAIAEAASNSCLSVLNEEYDGRWPDFTNAYPPSLHFCGGSSSAEICPTCRLFGMAQEKEGGTSEIGVRPQAFQGKVRFSDAVFEGNLDNIYAGPARLIILSTPKLSQNVWYHDVNRGCSRYPLAGRKFYYHHDSLIPKTDNSNGRLNQRATITPLKPGATFTFYVDFRNLLQSELDLLLYALELEPARELEIVENGIVRFNWQAVRQYPGVYPKLGYGKPAGLGSVCLLVTGIDLLDPVARYGEAGDGWGQHLQADEARAFVRYAKHYGFLHSRVIVSEAGKKVLPSYLSDLRRILRFPNGISTFRYPTLNEFKRYKKELIKLPLPKSESSWSP